METLSIINRTYDLYKTIFSIVAHMEKRHRFSIGKSMEESLLDVLKELIMAKMPQSL